MKKVKRIITIFMLVALGLLISYLIFTGNHLEALGNLQIEEVVNG